MSAHWKGVLRCLIEDPHTYSDILVNLYCVITDYHEGGIDTVCSDATLKSLQRAICQEDPLWALDEIADTQRCVRCYEVCIDDDIRLVRLCKPSNRREYYTEHYCDPCYNRVQDMLQEYDSDYESVEEEEENVDEKVEREAEWAAELGMGK